VVVIAQTQRDPAPVVAFSDAIIASAATLLAEDPSVSAASRP
jgi:hypothetical protein